MKETVLQTEKLSPLGVRVTNVDVNSLDHQAQIRNLLWENGVVILPAGAAAPAAVPVHQDESLATLGRLFGEVEEYHPINPTKGDTDVQILSTRGDSGIPSDSFLFHSDMSWRVNPSRASVLCGVVLPPEGGNTCFQSAHKMYQRLSPGMKDRLRGLSFVHSLDHGYSKVNRPGQVKNDIETTHPAVILHPNTREPLLYVNENFAKSCVGMSEEQSAELVKEVLKEAYCDDNILTHEWSHLDVVIWDNLGTQHLAKADYDELRTMHRVVAADPLLRLERYGGEEVDEKKAMDNIADLLNSEENSAAYAGYASRYDQDMVAAGYIVPRIATDLLAKHLKSSDRVSSKAAILDVAAGTGRNALHLLQKHKVSNMEAFDLTGDMLFEARRRQLYRAYHVGDANKALPMKDGKFDVTLCTGGLSPLQIKASPAIGEMVRVTKEGGLVVVTIQEKHVDYIKEVERVIGEGMAKMVEKVRFAGITSHAEIKHHAYVLEVV